MIFEYDDKFLTDNVEPYVIENIEAEKYNFVLNKLNINDNYYLEKLTKSLVYMELAKKSLESEGMKAKYDVYKAEYGHFLKLVTATGTEVFNISVARG